MKKMLCGIVLCFLAIPFVTQKSAEANRMSTRHALLKTGAKVACFPYSVVATLGVEATVEMLRVGLYANDKNNSPVSVSLLLKNSPSGTLNACIVFVDVPVVEIEVSNRLIV